MTDIIAGASPKLSSYTVTRKGNGKALSRPMVCTTIIWPLSLRTVLLNPLYVQAAYHPEAAYRDIELTTHTGQECDIIIKGKLKVQIGEHTEILSEGDSIYYDSSTPHGMIAVDGEDCLFYAIVLNPTGEPIPELVHLAPESTEHQSVEDQPAETDSLFHIAQRYITTKEDPEGLLQSVDFQNTETFNFAFDIVDEMARLAPDKLAMLHVDRNKVERRFTFEDISRHSSRAANYFKSLGIKKGDRVMLVLKRHYQFWFIMMALNKLGAIAIPATNQLLEHDFEYRFNAAGVSAIICTADGDVYQEAEKAADKCPGIKHRILVGPAREGWRDFDKEYMMFRSTFPRPMAKKLLRERT